MLLGKCGLHTAGVPLTARPGQDRLEQWLQGPRAARGPQGLAMHAAMSRELSSLVSPAPSLPKILPCGCGAPSKKRKSKDEFKGQTLRFSQTTHQNMSKEKKTDHMRLWSQQHSRMVRTECSTTRLGPRCGRMSWSGQSHILSRAVLLHS